MTTNTIDPQYQLRPYYPDTSNFGGSRIHSDLVDKIADWANDGNVDRSRIHSDLFDKIADWANDGNDDIAPTVEDQILLLNIGPVSATCCGIPSSGGFKTFVGEVMKFKRNKIHNPLNLQPGDPVVLVDAGVTAYREGQKAVVGDRGVHYVSGWYIEVTVNGSPSTYFVSRWMKDSSDSEQPANPYTLGSQWVINKDRAVSTPYTTGDVVEVVEESTDTMRVRLAGDPSALTFWMNPEFLDPIPAPGLFTQAQVDAAVAEAKAVHAADIERIGTRFWEQAKRRGWCSEAEDVIDELNQSLTVALPDQRIVDVFDWAFDLEVEVTLNDVAGASFSGRMNVTHYVNEITEDDAEDNDIDSDDVRTAVYNALPGSVDGDFTIDDWSVVDTRKV